MPQGILKLAGLFIPLSGQFAPIVCNGIAPVVKSSWRWLRRFYLGFSRSIVFRTAVHKGVIPMTLHLPEAAAVPGTAVMRRADFPTKMHHIGHVTAVRGEAAMVRWPNGSVTTVALRRLMAADPASLDTAHSNLRNYHYQTAMRGLALNPMRCQFCGGRTFAAKCSECDELTTRPFHGLQIVGGVGDYIHFAACEEAIAYIERELGESPYRLQDDNRYALFYDERVGSLLVDLVARTRTNRYACTGEVDGITYTVYIYGEFIDTEDMSQEIAAFEACRLPLPTVLNYEIA
jgi:hypothetical protein